MKDPQTGLHGWYEMPKSITTELDLWRAHERAWNDWWRSRHRAIAARRLAADATDQAVAQSRTIEADAEDLYRLQVIERDLQKVRAEMRGSGIELPILAEGMEHIDDEKNRQR